MESKENNTTGELVSVIMPSYNSSRFIAESIESILRQTYTQLELLITDDGSTDNTVEIIQAYIQKDSRIRLFTQKDNMGAGHARNHSIKEARGRYIAFCDSDDTWLPHKLEKQLAFMKENGYCFCFSSYFVGDESGNRTGIVIAPSSVTLSDTKRDDKIGFLTAIYDTSAHGKFYMPTLRKRQDWAYVLLILRKCRKAYSLKEPLACYRRSRGSISSNKLSLLKFNAQVYQTVFGYSTLHSYCYLSGLFLPTYTMKVINNWITNLRYRKNYRALK